MGGKLFLFFTIQSNITIASVTVAFLVIQIIELSKKITIKIPRWLGILKYIFTVAITLTFLVFSILLMPQMISSGSSAYLFSASNIFLHNLVPICVLIDWFIYDSQKLTFRKSDVFFGTLMPLYYFIFALVCSFCGISFGPGMSVPYFFMDYNKYGWLKFTNGGMGIIYWFIILVGVVLAICYTLMLVNKKRQGCKE